MKENAGKPKQVTDALAAMRADDDKYFAYGVIVYDGLSPQQREQLCQLLFHGPVYDGYILSKSARNDLIDFGLAIRCCFMGEQGYTAATYTAYSVHKQGNGDKLKPKPGLRG